MAVVKTQANAKRYFVGKGWTNSVNKADSPHNGRQFINITIDRGSELTLKEGDKIQLWPNKKRDGHDRDADWRMSVVVDTE